MNKPSHIQPNDFQEGCQLLSEESTVSSTNGVEKTVYPHRKRMKLDLYVMPCIKINSKWIEV